MSKPLNMDLTVIEYTTMKLKNISHKLGDLIWNKALIGMSDVIDLTVTEKISRKVVIEVHVVVDDGIFVINRLPVNLGLKHSK
jgi:hypothetical protein